MPENSSTKEKSIFLKNFLFFAWNLYYWIDTGDVVPLDFGCVILYHFYVSNVNTCS